jgi:hypothetical protein
MTLNYPFQIITYRAGAVVQKKTCRTRVEAETAFMKAVDAARLTAVRSRVPRRVELTSGTRPMSIVDLPGTTAR